MKVIYRLMLLLFTGLFYSCSNENYEIVNLNNNKIVILGHGGMGIASTYPINTQESLLKSLSIGADGTEFDVQMTKDSVLVLFHDSELNPKTNVKGAIYDHNWKEIQNAQYQDLPFLNFRLISLDQFFSNVPNIQQYHFTFECKPDIISKDLKSLKTYADKVMEIIEKYELKKEKIAIESQDTVLLNFLKVRSDLFELYIYKSNFQEGIEIAEKLKLDGISMSTKLICKEQIELAHKMNLKVAIWNTHTKKDNDEAIMKNPDFIQTDKLKDLIKRLN